MGGTTNHIEEIKMKVFIRLPHDSGAWEVLEENVPVFIEEYQAFLRDQKEGKFEHWEHLPKSNVANYWTIGALRRDSDIMLSNRPEFGLRPTAYDYLISLEDAVQRWGKSALPATV
jgi:hypothetical protein